MIALQTAYVALVFLATVFAFAIAAWVCGHRDLTARLFVAIALLYGIGGAVVIGELFLADRSLSIGLFGVHTAIVGGASTWGR